MSDTEERLFIKNLISDIEKQHKVKVIYVTKFGSKLYGTNGPNSDNDYMGIFLPNINNLLMDNAVHTISFHSSNDKTANTKDDYDLNLWSIQKWIKACEVGKTNAIDLLYSIGNDDTCMLFDTLVYGFTNTVKYNHNKFYKLERLQGFKGFAIKQTRNYFNKGIRVNLVNNIFKYCEDLRLNYKDKYELDTLYDHMRPLLSLYRNNHYCIDIDVPGDYFLSINGKLHQSTISMIEFRNRIKKELDGYGKRSKESINENKIDWKGISHSIRYLMEYRDIVNEGKIKFPLAYKDTLMDIKGGSLTMDNIEYIIMDLMSHIEVIEFLISPDDDHFDKAFILKFVKIMYKLYTHTENYFKYDKQK
jgi:predicted nucleotidyltransferase